MTPQTQGNNLDDYLSILCDHNLLDGYTKVKNAGNRRIYKAYKFFLDALDKYIGEEIETDKTSKPIQIIFRLLSKVNNSILVSIEVETNKDAYMLFESLNNRGVPLTAIDLIKNLLISVSDNPNNKRQVDVCYNQWNTILKYLGDDYSVQERFFRQYYNAYREELNKGFYDSNKMYALGYLATKSTLLDIYEKLIRKNYDDFLKDATSKAKIYSIIINNCIDNDDKIPELEEPLVNLERIQGAPSYLLLMYLLDNKEKLLLSNNDLADIVNYLISFFVRRNITDFPNTRNLNKIFMDLISKTNSFSGADYIIEFRKYLKENSSSDADFEKQLRSNVYLLNVDCARFLLCYYEDCHKTKEIHTDLWARDSSNKYIWTIEHIFPEGDKVPDSWVKMIANGDRDLANKYLEQYTHTFGNLTITGYNSNLSNLSFLDKMSRTKDGKEIGYRNGLKLNEDVVSETEWTTTKIQNRTDKLVEFFLEKLAL